MRNRINIIRNRIDILDSLPRIIRKSVELIYKYIDSKERAKKNVYYIRRVLFLGSI